MGVNMQGYSPVIKINDISYKGNKKQNVPHAHTHITCKDQYKNLAHLTEPCLYDWYFLWYGAKQTDNIIWSQPIY